MQGTFFESPQGREPYVLADHPVLDMLNTVANVGDRRTDFWQSDEDVIRWMVRTGWIDDQTRPSFSASSLLHAARRLREIVRELVVQRKVSAQGNPDALNSFLRNAPSYPQVIWDSPSHVSIRRVRKHLTPEQFLSPLAEAAATLLAEGDFNLIRTCEHSGCILWFYDRTKSHRRRWCSMALCGNRSKVAEFRKRKRQ